MKHQAKWLAWPGAQSPYDQAASTRSVAATRSMLARAVALCLGAELSLLQQEPLPPKLPAVVSATCAARRKAVVCKLVDALLKCTCAWCWQDRQAGDMQACQCGQQSPLRLYRLLTAAAPPAALWLTALQAAAH